MYKYESMKECRVFPLSVILEYDLSYNTVTELSAVSSTNYFDIVICYSTVC